MPRSFSFNRSRTDQETGYGVYRFYDRDHNQMPLTFNMAVFRNGTLLEPTEYSISHDNGVVISLRDDDKLQVLSFDN